MVGTSPAGLERAELGDRPAGDGDDDALAALGPAQDGGGVGPAGRGRRRSRPSYAHVYTCVHSCGAGRRRGTARPRCPAMNFAFSEEQEELRKVVRQFLETKSPEAEVRELMETERGLRPRRLDPDGRAARPPGPRSSPRSSAARATATSSSIVVLEEMGRAPAVRPVLLHRGAGRQHPAALAATTPPRRTYLPGIASGETIATLAFTEANGRWDEAGITATATKAGDGWTISRHEDVRARRPHRRPDPRRRPHRRRREPVRRRRRRRRASPARPLSTMDQTRKQAKLEFADTPATLHRHRGRGLGRARAGARPRRRGPGRRAGRWRPGRASRWPSSTPRTGSSSAGPSARSRPSSTSAPTCCSRSSRPSRPPTTPAGAPRSSTTSCPRWPSLAKAYCSEAYFHAAAENIQIHGGIGFTWEHPAHLYFKRAKSSELLFGDPTYHRELLAQRIGI